MTRRHWLSLLIVTWLCSVGGSTPAHAPFVTAAPDHARTAVRAQQWYLDHIGMPSHPRHGAPVTVALIDAGIDRSAPQLRTQIAGVINIVAPDTLRDHSGHATHSAGIIAAAPSTQGMQGICPGCRLLVIKAISEHGYGSDATVARAIERATAQRVGVINLSIGGAVASPRLHRAVAAAIAADIVVVAAVGNDGASPHPRLFPAGYPGVIGVGASDQTDRVAAFSSTGPDTDIVAPGVDIASITSGTRIQTADGTSCAAAQVSAAAAVLRSWFPRASAAEIRIALLQSAIDLDTPGPDPRTGHGLLNIAAAARLLAGAPHQLSAR